ncbi:hypothetical protein DTV46_17520 [Salmonella enterica subsp. salamae]|uniref:fimbrial protein n=3 Tax=Salmonella enterica TaxID=28901 RepID=UPI00107D1BE2|nr:fimbrial protein [Salmonella enterica]EAB9750842.1 hypothetical protein [Salmonella enterica subsp. salamae]
MARKPMRRIQNNVSWGKRWLTIANPGCVSLSSMIGAVWIPVRGGGHAYCIANESFDAPLRLKRGYGTPAGQTPDGHAMWKTNITGLYFAVEVYALYTANSALSTELPFQINLADCSYIKNIEVKLASTAIGSDNTLLSNTLTGSSAASGISVQIQGIQTNLSNQMVLIPGDANSIYRYSPYASQSDYIDSANKYSTHTLNFLATLKQDNNNPITAGDFKATGTFQMTSP